MPTVKSLIAKRCAKRKPKVPTDTVLQAKKELIPLHEQRTEQDRQEARRRRAAYGNEVQQKKTANDEALKRAVQALKEKPVPNGNNCTVLKPCLAARPTNAFKSVDNGPKPWIAPLASELQKMYQIPCSATPSVDVLADMSTTVVFSADTKNGLRVWGADRGPWAIPERWTRPARLFGHLHQHNESTHVKWRRDAGIELVHRGQYNAVYLFLDDALERGVLDLPAIVHNGTHVSYKHLALRTTRGEQYGSGKGAVHRLRPFDEAKNELYATLQASALGYAPQCFAAVMVPVTESPKGHLYATIFIMERAAKDMGTLMEDQERIRRKQQEDKGVSASSFMVGNKYRERCILDGALAAKHFLPVLVKQALACCFDFDIKPANYVLLDKEPHPMAIDFDAIMHVCLETGECDWRAALLLALTMLTAHVRCARAPAFAMGWATALRPLILDLVKSVRSTRWLFEARARVWRYTDISGTDPANLRRRFEMLSYLYFVNCDQRAVTSFSPDTSTTGPGLLLQLLRFGLHGTIRMEDRDLDVAFGVHTIHR